jgi:hypothetical protein
MLKVKNIETLTTKEVIHAPLYERVSVPLNPKIDLAR